MYDENVYDLDHLAKRMNHHRLEVMGVLHEVRELTKEVAALKADLDIYRERVNALMQWAV